jgi:2-dehydropantoate 2-reductase
MHIAVMGSGAVGGYFGAKLAAAGHELSFIARGQHLEAMKRNGLQVHSPNGNLDIQNAQCSADPQSVGRVDLVLFCVKSYDSESAGQAIAPIVSDPTRILSLQNGIDNPDKLARIYGERRVLPAVVYVGAQLAAPGLIIHSSGGRIIIGQLDGTVNEESKALAKVFTAAGIPCETSGEIRQVQWTKLLWNAPFCAISCLTHANTKQIVESPALTQLALDCMAEVQWAARSQGIELAAQLCADALAFSKTLGEFKPSMLQDLEAHKPLEYAAFNGIVVKLLESAHQTAPINRTFSAALEFLDQKIRQEVKP